MQEDVTLVGWDQGVEKGGDGGVRVRIIGGSRASMVHVGGQVESGELPLYDESQEVRCGFWNREDVLAGLSV